VSLVSLSATLDIAVSARMLYRPGEGQPIASLPVGISDKLILPNGDAVGEVDCAAFIRAEGVAASANVDYDLRALTDSTGLTGEQEFASVSAIVIRNRRATALTWLKFGPKDGTNGALILGSPTAGKGLFNAGTDRLVIPPNGIAVLYSGEAIPTSATFKDLRVTASGITGDVNAWDLLILGVSA
jgi:hypothetical protein